MAPSSLPALYAGVGCTASARSRDVLALLEAALPATGTLISLASLDRRCRLPALTETAAMLTVPLLGFSEESLRNFPQAAPSAAARLSGVPSVAEAAALASASARARPGQTAVLWLAKQTGAGCTVALAVLTDIP